MRRLALAVGTATLVLAAACAPKTVPLPVVSAPRFPAFVRPSTAGPLAADPAATNVDRGWTFLQAGDFLHAEQELTMGSQASPAYYPVDAAFGWLELARGNATAALPHFDQALARDAHYVSALVGRGQALVGLNRPEEAIPSLDAAVAADPSLADVTRQLQVLRFQSLQTELTRARQAAAAGRLDEAKAAYTKALAASPDSPFLYRELGVIERELGDADAALDHFRHAVQLDPSDSQAQAEIGRVLEARGDFDGAAAAYAAAMALDPDNRTFTALHDGVVARSALARLPAQYRAIGATPQVTRGEMAALIGVRLSSIVDAAPRADVGIMTDVRGHWAANWILSVAAAGLMEPYPNHTFQPLAVVRRSDLAEVVSRLLTRIGAANPAAARAWQSPSVRFSDIPPGHLAYAAAAMAVSAGVMAADRNGAFRPSDAVSGAEAVQAVDRLQALAALGQTTPVQALR